MVSGKRRAAALFLALVCLISLFSCGKKDARILESSKLEKTPLMTVDGIDVPLELYRYVALNYKADYEAAYSSSVWSGADAAEKLEELDNNVKDTLVKLCATLSLCRKYGISEDDTYITDAVDQQMQDLYEEADNDYEGFDEYLRGHNMTDGVYRFIIRNDILAEELLARMIQNGELPSEEEELEAILTGPDFVRVKQILVPSDNGKTEAENEARAEELAAMAQAGEDFDALVQKYGGDLFMFNNPDGYYISRGNYHKAFEEAAFSLSVGEISGVVRTDAGWSVLKRYEKEADYLLEHFDDLADEYLRGQYNEKLEAYAASLSAEPTERLAEYTIFNLNTTY